jgi:hypothetical protein
MALLDAPNPALRSNLSAVVNDDDFYFGFALVEAR